MESTIICKSPKEPSQVQKDLLALERDILIKICKFTETHGIPIFSVHVNYTCQQRFPDKTDGHYSVCVTLGR